MTGRVTGRTVVNGVPAVNVMFRGFASLGYVYDVKVLDPDLRFEIGDIFKVRKDGI